MESVKRRKAQGLQDLYLYDYTFANHNGQNPMMKKTRAYVEHWSEAKASNTGLLLFGKLADISIITSKIVLVVFPLYQISELFKILLRIKVRKKPQFPTAFLLDIPIFLFVQRLTLLTISHNKVYQYCATSSYNLIFPSSVSNVKFSSMAVAIINRSNGSP